MRRTTGGVWRFASEYEPFVPREARLTLGEGDTPLEAHPGLAAPFGLDRLLLKREDQNPTGSHKDRGAAYVLSVLGRTRPGEWVVISSSGNAAVAAAAYAALAGLRLAAFVAPGTPPAKIGAMRRQGATVFVSDRAVSLASETAKAIGAPNLRPSVDPLAVEGFLSLGWELAAAEPPVEAVFTFASSGTSLVGIGRAFQRAAAVVGSSRPPALHVVQGAAAQSIAGPLDRRRTVATASRLGAHGAAKTRRLGEAVRLVRRSGGGGWVITDDEAAAASAHLSAAGIAVAPEAAAALAAAGRAAHEVGIRSAIVVMTGGASVEGEGEALGSDASAVRTSGSIDGVAGWGEAAAGPAEGVASGVSDAAVSAPVPGDGGVHRVNSVAEVRAVLAALDRRLGEPR